MDNRATILLEALACRSFTKAARKLHYSQSAVSQAVKALEDELGTRLVVRGRQGIVLTADGYAYLPYLRSIAQAEEALRQKKQEMEGLTGGLVRIGAFTSVTRNLLIPLIARFHAAYPEVGFELQQGQYDQIRTWVAEGTVDFGFVNKRMGEGLSLQEVYKDRMVAVLPADDPLASRATVSLADLKDRPFIELDEGSQSLALEAFSRAGITPRRGYKVYDDYTILDMVRAGLGYSIQYSLALAGYASGVAVRPLEEAIVRTIALAWKDWQTMPMASRRFGTFMLAEAPDLVDALKLDSER